ncbi:MAG: hypothetical protein ACYC7E_15205 [Armatimonadota bacterium]
MKTLLISLGLLVMLIGASVTADAYPALFGPTGDAVLPTADVAMAGQLNLAASYYDTEVNETIPLRVLFGVGYNTEIGAVYALNDAEDIWGVNLKYGFMLGGHGGWALGALYNQGVDSDDTSTQVYLLHTHPFAMEPVGIRATIGVNYTWVDIGGIDENAFRAYIVGDLILTQMNNMVLSAEYQTESSDLGDVDALWSLAVRHPFSSNLALEIGYTNASPLGMLGSNDHRFYAGLIFGTGGMAGGMESHSGAGHGHGY